LPYDVPANEFMNMEDKKISGSANWGVWGLDFLERFQPDALRFYLTINMPETKDSNWDWNEFVTRNNSQLVATWGNLANRVLSFAHKYWEGIIPTPGELKAIDKAVLAEVEKGFGTVGDLINQVKLRNALRETIRIASEVNKYLDDTAPWSTVKNDKDTASTTIYVAMNCINNLKVLFAPFLPHSSEQLHKFYGNTQPLFGEQYTEEVKDELGTHTTLRYKNETGTGEWAFTTLEPGASFEKPSPLYQKLDPSVADEERERLENSAS
ncbi:MAG: class I tRNA ligase family protein, partial [Chloroflexota bacterium]